MQAERDNRTNIPVLRDTHGNRLWSPAEHMFCRQEDIGTVYDGATQAELSALGIGHRMLGYSLRLLHERQQRSNPPAADPLPQYELVQETPSAVLDALPPATMVELKQAALRVARGAMGYDEFLKKNPQFHHKFLLSMAKEQLPQERPTVEVNISWLSNDRLAYKQGPLVGNVEDAVLCATSSSVALSTEHQNSSAALSATSSSVALSTEHQAWKPGALSPGQLLDKLEHSQDQTPAGPDIQIK